jgi:mycoredoxin
MTKIKIYGNSWCGDCKRALRIFDERKIEYDWIDIGRDPLAEKLVKEINHGNRSVPTIIFPDETILVEPSNNELNGKLDSIEN